MAVILMTIVTLVAHKIFSWSTGPMSELLRPSIIAGRVDADEDAQGLSPTPHRVQITPGGLLFECGWNSPRDFWPLLFPQVNRSSITRFSRHAMPYPNASQNDFLLFGMHGPCDAPYGPRKTTHLHVQESFPGKALFINSEPMGDARGDNTYQIGLVPDSNRSVQVFSVAIFVVSRCYKYGLEKIFDPTQKPRNTGEGGVVYVSSRCRDFRDYAADNISDVDPTSLIVEYGGSCRGKRDAKTSKLVRLKQKAPPHSDFVNNVEVYRRFRYCLVLENSQVAGYISEKIALAFLAGCVPIYYGTEQVFQLFNREAFIFYDKDDPQQALLQIRSMQTNLTIYEKMLAQPILVNGDETIENFFSLRDDVGNGTLIRRIRDMLGYATVPHAALRM